MLFSVNEDFIYKELCKLTLLKVQELIIFPLDL